ncbi:branched-chain amino acid ABC transporter permease [Azospirillum sp.]|uniref:branched-chain amino acid ABC transporter permease n=1 Tax=Azospirillum sp. TaxID=34012 RepID=UPI003D75015C
MTSDVHASAAPARRGGIARALLKPRTGGLGLLALTIALLPLALPNAYAYDIAINAGLNAIVCVGLNLLVGYAGQISLGHAAFFGLGAYASGILTTRYGWPALGALAAGAVLVGVLAFAVARPVLRLKGHYLAMATLGLGVIISIVLNTESWITGGPDGLMLDDLTVLGWKLAGDRTWYGIVGATLLLTVWLALNLIDSPVGRALRALHGTEIGAQVVGVDTAHYKVLAFVVSAVIAAVAGSLFAHYAGMITPGKAGFMKSVELVTMVVFGGMASTFGAIVGAVSLTVLPQLLVAFEDYESIVLGLIMIGTMVFMRRGLFVTLLDLARSWRRS